MQVLVNDFVKRQTADSKFSHFQGSFDGLRALVEEHFDNQKDGYTDGVILVTVPADLFFSPMCVLQAGDKIVGTYESRQDDEEPRLSLGVVGGTKKPAVNVEIVLYRSDILRTFKDTVLVKDDSMIPDASLEERKQTWEIISVNANSEEGDIPIDPMTFLHNHFGSDGGTATNMTAEEAMAVLRVSFEYHKTHMLAAE
jgi:hypothetical protein